LNVKQNIQHLKTNLASFNNSWYKPGNKLKIILWYYTSILFFKSSFLPISSFKIFLLKCFGAKMGSNVLIKPSVNIKYPWFLTIGNNVWIGENVWIDNLAQVTIADNVCISQGALLLCGNHNYQKSTFDLMVKPIVLEEGVWVCAKAVITGGVVCGSHSIIGIGSVLTANSIPYGIYKGNPASFIKEREMIS
jgi:putative colanic acid biosynthesis acetyltransferase WcaF